MFENYPDVVTVDQLAEMLNICPRAAYRLLAAGTIKALRIGRIWRIPKQAVIAYVTMIP